MKLAIDPNQNILFDIVMFDNGPESFHDGLLRVLRNGKMGYANRFGQIVIPCIYDYAKWFDNGQSEVTFKAKEYIDMDALETALYNGLINPAMLAQAQTKKEVVTLRIRQEKKED